MNSWFNLLSCLVASKVPNLSPTHTANGRRNLKSVIALGVIQHSTQQSVVMNETNTLIQDNDPSRQHHLHQGCGHMVLLFLNFSVLCCVIAMFGVDVATFVQTQTSTLPAASVTSCFQVLFNGGSQPAFFVNRCNLPVVG